MGKGRARHLFALARISPAEVEKMDQKHFPVQVHVTQETSLIDPIMLLEELIWSKARTPLDGADIVHLILIGPDQCGDSASTRNHK